MKITIEQVCATLNSVVMEIAEEGKDIREFEVRYDAERDEFRLEMTWDGFNFRGEG